MLFVFCVLYIAMSFVFMGATSPYRVVIDPGHGGIDGGVTGRILKLKESQLNLEIAHLLRYELITRGVDVTMTRDGIRGLASSDAPHKQRDDLTKRKRVIESVKPDLVVSIHMNNFLADHSVKGLQVFYHSDIKEGKGKDFAVKIQESLNHLNEREKHARPGDYYILETAFPSVIIECGFLSNADDEKKLGDKGYQKKLAAEIADAIMETLG